MQAFLSENRKEEIKPKGKTKTILLVSKISSTDIIYFERDIESVITTENEADFAIHYRHDNMFSSIRKGDILLIRLISQKKNSLEDGTVVLTFNNAHQKGDPAEVFSFFYRKPFFIFESDNPKYRPLLIEENQFNKEVTIIGKIVESRRDYNKAGDVD